MLYFLCTVSKKIQKWVLTILTRDDLLAARKPEMIKAMSYAFSNFSQATEMVFDQLTDLVEEEPGFIAESTRMLLDSKGIFIKFLESASNQKKDQNLTIRDKIAKIADMHESVSLLKFPAYLLSGRKADIKKLTDAKAILVHFKFVGISAQVKEQIRLIRNAKSHIYTIENEFLVVDGTKISVKEIEEAYEKFDSIFSWWITFLAFSLWYFLKLTVIVGSTIYSSFPKNSSSWEAFGKGISIFYADVIAEHNEKKEINESPKKNKVWIFLNKIKSKVYSKKPLSKKPRTKPIIDDQLPMIVDLLQVQFAALIFDLNILAGKFGNIDDQSNLQYLIEWLINKQKKIVEAKQQASNDLEKLHEFLLNEF